MDDVIQKAKGIRLLILDVDGVLTDGTLYYGNDGLEVKSFHIHDGLGIQLLQQSGVAVAIISGKTSEGLRKRIDELSIQHAYLSQGDKLPAYESLKQRLNLSDQDIAYMGDDLPDLPLLHRAGFAISVPNAASILFQYVDFVTENKGGEGAVREVCELIMEAQGNYQSMIQSYLD